MKKNKDTVQNEMKIKIEKLITESRKFLNATILESQKEEEQGNFQGHSS